MVKMHLYIEKEGTETGERGGDRGLVLLGAIFFLGEGVVFQIKKIFTLLIPHPL